MIVYQTDREGVFVSPVEADKSPLEPDVFLIPQGAVTVEPPEVNPGEQARWDGNEWVTEPISPRGTPKFKGWVWNPVTLEWEPPTPKPAEDAEWDDETESWVVFVPDTSPTERDLLTALARLTGVTEADLEAEAVKVRDERGTGT
jgi:hypothetical protein